MAVTLKIKSPSAAMADLELQADVEDTVLDLKKQISLSYPTKPCPNSQKLVYLGKILRDADRLEEFLRFEDDATAYTLHLVCAMPRRQEEPAPAPDGLRQRPTPASLATPVPPPASYTAPSISQTSMEDMMRTFSSQYQQVMTSLPAQPSQEELATMQELYSQYLGLYMQYLEGAGAAQYQPLVAPPVVPRQEVQGVQEGAQVHGQGVQVQGPDAGVVMNAGGGGAVAQAEAGGERNRDILDWVYVMTRVMLLFSVIYFHSSFWRLAFVAGLGFLVFLYQNRQQGRARQLQAAPPAPAPAPVRQPSEEPEEGDQEEEEEGEEVVVEEPKPSVLAVTVTFFTSLISSIIPEQNNVL